MGCCSIRVSWRLILHQVWKANWDPERGSKWNLQCWRLWGLSEWIWIPPQVWIGVATTVGTYKAAAPDPSDLELISSAASKENPPGWFVYGNSGRKTLRFGALHFYNEWPTSQPVVALKKQQCCCESTGRKQRIGCFDCKAFYCWMIGCKSTLDFSLLLPCLPLLRQISDFQGWATGSHYQNPISFEKPWIFIDWLVIF